MPHGECERMFGQSLVPFGIRSAQMLMAVAQHPVISNTKHVSFLPPSWGTLYELTKVHSLLPLLCETCGLIASLRSGARQ